MDVTDTQGSLFDHQPDPANDPYNGTNHPQNPCVPAAIGSGPGGETCGTCRYLRRIVLASTYRKCGLMERHWTGGGGTDIKCAWRACTYWGKSRIPANE